MRVDEACNEAVVTADPSLGIVRAAEIMRDRHVGTLVVVEMRAGVLTPTGIVTDRDIVVEVLAKNVPLQSVTLGDLVSGQLLTARPDDDLFDTLDRMRLEGVRRMPVVDGTGNLVGILSVDDVLAVISKIVSEVPQLARHQRVGEVVRRP